MPEEYNLMVSFHYFVVFFVVRISHFLILCHKLRGKTLFFLILKISNNCHLKNILSFLIKNLQPICPYAFFLSLCCCKKIGFFGDDNNDGDEDGGSFGFGLGGVGVNVPGTFDPENIEIKRNKQNFPFFVHTNKIQEKKIKHENFIFSFE